MIIFKNLKKPLNLIDKLRITIKVSKNLLEKHPDTIMNEHGDKYKELKRKKAILMDPNDKSKVVVRRSTYAIISSNIALLEDEIPFEIRTTDFTYYIKQQRLTASGMDLMRPRMMNDHIYSMRIISGYYFLTKFSKNSFVIVHNAEGSYTSRKIKRIWGDNLMEMYPIKDERKKVLSHNIERIVMELTPFDSFDNTLEWEVTVCSVYIYQTLMIGKKCKFQELFNISKSVQIITRFGPISIFPKNIQSDDFAVLIPFSRNSPAYFGQLVFATEVNNTERDFLIDEMDPYVPLEITFPVLIL